MGISTFVVVIKDVGQLHAARRAIEAHNKVPPDARVKLPQGETFATIDPKRSAVAEAFRQHLQGSSALNGFEESFHGGQSPEGGVTFARGEDIRSEGCFVLYKGDVWLEVANGTPLAEPVPARPYVALLFTVLGLMIQPGNAR